MTDLYGSRRNFIGRVTLPVAFLSVAGCTTTERQVGPSRSIQGPAVEYSNKTLLSSRSLLLLQHPTAREPFLRCRLQKNLKLTLGVRRTTYQEVTIEKRSSATSEGLQAATSELDGDALNDAFMLATAPVRFLFGWVGGPVTRVENRISPGPNTYEEIIKEELTVEPAENEQLMSEAFGSVTTDAMGVVSYRCQPDVFDRGVIVHHPSSGQQFRIERFLRRQTIEAPWYPYAKIAYEVYELNKHIVRLRRVSKIASGPGIVASVVIDYAIGKVVGWLLEHVGTSEQSDEKWFTSAL
jgi:hypothetical protein